MASSRRNKDSLWNEIGYLDHKLEEDGCLFPYLKDKKNQILREIESILRREDTFWSQKAKCKWLKDGDGNTKYFHKVANDRKRKNTISSLSIQGHVEQDFGQIKDGASRFFSLLYKDERRDRPRIPNLFSNRIDSELTSKLKRPFSSDKVKNAIMCMGKDKFLEPDGFLMLFFLRMLRHYSIGPNGGVR